MNKATKYIKNIIISFCIVAVVYGIIKLLCVLFGNPSFGTGNDLQTIIYTAIYTSMISLAMSYNLHSGRFDFSVGATISLAAIIGGNIAKSFELPAIGLILVIVVVGMILGAINGLVYVTLQLPPMVSTMGMALIYEAVGLLVNKGQGIKMIGKVKVLIFAQAKWLWVLLLIVAIVSTFIFDYTRFGYNRKALMTGQKIAVDIGINEKRNAVGCWIAAGALLGVAASIYLSKYGTVSPESGLSSSQYFMGAFLPLFVGGALAKFSNNTIGIILGAFISAMISSAFVKLGFSSSVQTVLNGACVLVFLVYTSNSYKFVIKKMYKEKLAKAVSAGKEAA